jgi:hypothetical protein
LRPIGRAFRCPVKGAQDNRAPSYDNRENPAADALPNITVYDDHLNKK